MDKIQTAQRILAADENVLYGIFGVVAASSFFPPHKFLNEFLVVGNDPCDQDNRMPSWNPFELSIDEYSDVKTWWISKHPGTTLSSLDVDNWDDWIQEVLELRG
jgi:hypothetical protein